MKQAYRLAGEMDMAFGPVPSRRFGRSLGVNNVPPKTCSYACVYCQAGRTDRYRCSRGRFCDPNRVVEAVGRKLEIARKAGKRIDCVTFVSEGEPTLDLKLGAEIELLTSFGHAVAVITNGSLLWRADVRRDIGKADQVSLKVDAVREDLWRALDRPHKDLRLPVILQGQQEFARSYQGRLLTETMLVRGINDSPSVICQVARFVASLRPARAYLSVPTRPPAESHARAPRPAVIRACRDAFSREFPHVGLLSVEPGGDFGCGEDPVGDVLGITAVHPMREESLRAMVAKSEGDWGMVEALVAQGRVVVTERAGERFYRKVSPRRRRTS